MTAFDRQSTGRLEGSFVAKQQPTIFDLPKVLAVGIASPAAAAITARFGVAGTLIGFSLVCCVHHSSGRLPKGLPGARARGGDYHTGGFSKKVFFTKRFRTDEAAVL